MDTILSFLPQELSAGTGLLLTILILAFYLAECFLGYKFIRSWISAAGFFLGAIAGFQVINRITGHAGYGVLAALLCGILLSVLAYRVYLIGVFIIAALGIYQISMTFLPLNGDMLYIASAIIGLIAAYLAIKYMRPAIICITAFHGGTMAATMIPLFIALPVGVTPLMLGIGLGAAGTAVQFLTTKD